jgi:RNA recognition motif-containing protein
MYLFKKVCDIMVALIFSGNTPETRGTAFVVYEDIFDAKNACDHLSGFNVCNRYLVVLYYQVSFVLSLV